MQMSAKSFRGNRIAYVTTIGKVVAHFAKIDRIKIGWVNYRTRQAMKRPKCCYRCLDYRHIAAYYKGVNKAGACWWCSEKSHVAACCMGTAVSCYLCRDVTVKAKAWHVPGSAQCNAAKAARVAF